MFDGKNREKRGKSFILIEIVLRIRGRNVTTNRYKKYVFARINGGRAFDEFANSQMEYYYLHLFLKRYLVLLLNRHLLYIIHSGIFDILCTQSTYTLCITANFPAENHSRAEVKYGTPAVRSLSTENVLTFYHYVINKNG